MMNNNNNKMKIMKKINNKNNNKITVTNLKFKMQILLEQNLNKVEETLLERFQLI